MSTIELTDEQGNKAQFTISFGNVTIIPAPIPEPKPIPVPPPVSKVDAPYQPKAGGRVIKQNPDAASVSQLFPAGRLDGLSATKNADGSWKVKGSPRWHLMALAGEPDFDDFCMVLDYKHISGNAAISLYAHRENHSKDVKQAWHGSKNALRYFADNGDMHYQRELYHQSGDGSGYSNSSSDVKSDVKGGAGVWLTVKAIFYKSADGKKRVIEGWIDTGGNNWKMVMQIIDENGNNVDVRRSNTGSGPEYDGLHSYHAYYDGSWHHCNTASNSRDLLFKITNTGQNDGLEGDAFCLQVDPTGGSCWNDSFENEFRIWQGNGVGRCYPDINYETDGSYVIVDASLSGSTLSITTKHYYAGYETPVRGFDTRIWEGSNMLAWGMSNGVGIYAPSLSSFSSGAHTLEITRNGSFSDMQCGTMSGVTCTVIDENGEIQLSFTVS